MGYEDKHTRSIRTELRGKLQLIINRIKEQTTLTSYIRKTIDIFLICSTLSCNNIKREIENSTTK